MRNSIIIMLALLVYSCNNKPNESKSSSPDDYNKFFNIKYEELLENKSEIGLSQIASNIEYIVLETNKEFMIGRSANYFFTDSLIFVSNEDHILRFSRNGKFLNKIGNPGRGPGEIDYIRIMSVIPDKKIIVVQKSGESKLIYFSFDGELIKTISIPLIANLKVLYDGSYIAYVRGSLGSEKYTFRLTNESGDTISVIHNHDMWTRNSQMVLTIRYTFEPFYYYKNKCYFKSMYNDTVYFADSNKIKPAYFLNFGKYKLPDNLRPEKLSPDQFQMFPEKAINYYFGSVFEASNKIFMMSSSYGERPSVYIMYDKKDQLGNVLINSDNESKGFINDWDGSIDFWPIGNVNDNQIYMPINIIDFQKEFEKEKHSENSIKFPKKQKQLKDMISSLDVSNNPIIMVVTLKSDK